ncbi:hypothetical protein BDQ17DRAFT_1351557 [Cyathus striatus]|nr:hypothetical protein BDQ17DRAFT_1351557 [Cyathus striatus]
MVCLVPVPSSVFYSSACGRIFKHLGLKIRPRPVHPDEPLRLQEVLTSDVYWELGISYADRCFATHMDGDDDSSEIKAITWGEVLRESYRASRYLKQFVEERSTSRTTMGIFANSCYAYYVHLVAAILNDWTLILLSPRNSLAGLESLMTAVKGNVILADELHYSTAETLTNQMPGLTLIKMQTRDEFSGPCELPQYHPRNSPPTEEELQNVLYYIHSSGSQGHPKPIPYTHRRFLADVGMKAARDYADAPVYAPVPLFHGMGIYAFTRWPMRSGLVPAFVDMKQPLNGEALVRHVARLPGAIGFLPPIVLEEVYEGGPSEIVKLKNFKRILAGGAPMNQKAAETLIEHGIPLSETSLLSTFDFLGKDWRYYKFTEGQFDFQFIPIDNSDSSVRELFISPSAIDSPSVINCQDPLGYSTTDLWIQHPTKPKLWKYFGRKDAVTVLSNGEKTDNGQIERLLLEDPLITGVVVFGSGKPLNGILLRPSATGLAMSQEAFIQAIWPTIERTNSIIPNHSRILRQMILVADASKPLAHTDKGTIRQKESLSLYEKEIEECYENFENASSGPQINMDSLTFCKVAGKDVPDDADFFEFGLDSLHAIQIRAEIIPLLSRLVKGSVPHNVVHAHPSISRIAVYAVSLRSGGTSIVSAAQAKRERIQACVKKFTSGFTPRKRVAGNGTNGTSNGNGVSLHTDSSSYNSLTNGSNGHTNGNASNGNSVHTGNGHIIAPPSPTSPSSSKHTVILTGGTGSLGSHILNGLMEKDNVEHVYCFHRSNAKPLAGRHIQLCRKWDIPEQALEKNWMKLKCIGVDLGDPGLGIESSIFEEMRTRVTHIIHAAWELNFNWSLDRFEKTHIAGVRNLVDLALSSPQVTCPKLVFISSIGTVSGYSSSSPIPEVPFDDPAVAGEEGYSEAKYVAERIVDQASLVGLRGTVIRSGQLSGSTVGGHWAAMSLGKLPADLPDVHWLPADVAAASVLDIAFHDEPNTPVSSSDSGSLNYYHLENPTKTSWKEILKMFCAASGRNLEEVPTNVWLKEMEVTAGSGKADDFPALALHQFYSDYALSGSTGASPSLDTRKAARISPGVNFGEITEDLMRKYTRWFDLV